MTNILFTDTETTGLFDRKGALSDKHQPWPVQLAVIFDMDSRVRTFGSFIINPKAKIEKKALEAHKISPTIAEAMGIDVRTAVLFFLSLAERADMIVGHNVDFDMDIIRSAAARLKIDDSLLQNMKTFCTMRRSTDVCQIPKARGSGFKWPKLEEAYTKLIDPKGFTNAHDAMMDTKACRTIFYHLVNEHGITP